VESRLQIVSIVVSAGLFGLVFELVRRRRLMERYALLWMFATAVLLGLSVWGNLLDEVSRAVGVRYGPSTLFAVALGFIVMLMLHFSLVISRIADQNKILAQRVAILQRRLDRLEQPAVGAAPGEAPAPAPAPAEPDVSLIR
jgi:hypothetical protein